MRQNATRASKRAVQSPKRRIRVGLIETLEIRRLLAAVSWAGPASGGDWDTAANWSNNAIPTSADNVTIGANVSINHAAGTADSVHSLTSGAGDTLNLSGGSIAFLSASNLVNLNESGGSLMVDAAVSMSGTASKWTGGYVDGGGSSVNGVLTNTGTVTISTGSAKYVLDNGTLSNQGTVIADDDLNLQNGTVNNSGTYDFQNSSNTASVVNSGGALFNNSGILKKSAGAAAATIGTVTFNSGAGATIEADVSTLTLGGVNGTYLSTNFVANGAAVIDMTGGQTTSTYTGSYSGTGTGQLHLASGEINVGAAGVTFNFAPGFFQWSGGYVGGSGSSVNGVLTNTGTVTLVPGSAKYLLQNASLDNAGSVIADDDLNLQNGTVNNSGTYDFQNSSNTASVVNGGGALFNNSGILKKSTGAAGASIGTLVFNNSAGATIENDVSGTTLTMGGTNGTYLSTHYVANGTAVIDMTGGQTTSTYTGSYSGSGTGQLKLASGQINVGAAGVTFNFAPGFFQWSGGYVSGSGSTVNGVLTNTATITLVPGTTKYLYQNGTLNNSGTFIADDDLNLQNATVNNSATYDFQNSANTAAIGNGGNAVFNNLPTGILKKSAGAGFGVSINGDFNNSAGAIIENDVSGTTLTLGGVSGTYLGAQFVANGTAVIDMTGGQTSNTYTGSYSGSGTGLLKLASGVLNLGAAGATFNFAPGFFQWSAGYVSGSGSSVNGVLTNTGTITLLPGSTKYLYQNGTLNNSGTFIANDDLNLQNATVNVDSGGVYDFQNAGAAAIVNGGNATFNNLLGGTLKKSSGAGPASINSGITINMPGTTEVDASSLTINDSIPQFTGTTLSGGTWIVTSGATLSTPSNPTVTTIDNGASVVLSDPGSSWSSVAAATPTTVTTNDGNFSLLNGRSVSATAFASTGGLTLGTGTAAQSGSALDVTGSYTQSSTGSLTTLIGGRPSSGQFGSITAAGATLAGAFTGHLANGFVPVVGDQYVLINNTGSSPVSGTFAGLSDGQVFQIDGVSFSIHYNAGPNGQDVVLTVPLLVTSVVVNGNLPALAGVQRSMVNSIVYTFNYAAKLAATNAFTIGVHSGQTGTAPTLTWTAINPDASGGSTQWAVSFSGAGVSGGSIADGVYDITLNSAAATAEASPSTTVNPRATDTFYRMYGDAQGTEKVNSADYTAFLSTYGLKSTAPGFLSYFADDGSTKIDSADYNAFLSNFGKKLSGFTATI